MQDDRKGRPSGDSGAPSGPAGAALLRRALSGDAEAFRKLYDGTSAAVYGYALSIACERSAAEDITQDVYLSVLRKGSTYDSARPFLGWLLALTRNGAIDHMRRRRVRAALTDRGHLEQLRAPSRDPATAELVEHALSLIPANYREAVWLCDALGLSYAEASEALQCDIGTIGSRVSRGRQLLREHLMRNGHAM